MKRYVKSSINNITEYRNMLKQNPSEVRRNLKTKLQDKLLSYLPEGWQSDFIIVNKPDMTVKLQLSRVSINDNFDISSKLIKSLVENAVVDAGLSSYVSKIAVYSDGGRGNTWKSVNIYFDTNIWSL